MHVISEKKLRRFWENGRNPKSRLERGIALPNTRIGNLSRKLETYILMPIK
jgi:hypothetical protein